VSETRLMMYAEFAEAIGRSLPAARAICIRKNWRRIVGNDGKARVAIPLEVLEKPRKPRTQPAVQPEGESDARAEATPNARPEGDAEDLPEGVSVIALLRGQIARLEEELERARDGLDEAKAALEVERIRAAQVDVLTALLEVERKHVALVADDARQRTEEARQRADELRDDRDRWAGIAEAHQRQVAELLAPKPSRGWWPFRRVG
jgi:hypothetical protein